MNAIKLDVTDFAANHPGGDKILLAAGGAVDPFWAMYQQHFEPFVQKLLPPMRVVSVYQTFVSPTLVSSLFMYLCSKLSSS